MSRSHIPLILVFVLGVAPLNATAVGCHEPEDPFGIAGGFGGGLGGGGGDLEIPPCVPGEEPPGWSEPMDVYSTSSISGTLSDSGASVDVNESGDAAIVFRASPGGLFVVEQHDGCWMLPETVTDDSTSSVGHANRIAIAESGAAMVAFHRSEEAPEGIWSATAWTAYRPAREEPWSFRRLSALPAPGATERTAGAVVGLINSGETFAVRWRQLEGTENNSEYLSWFDGEAWHDEELTEVFSYNHDEAYLFGDGSGGFLLVYRAYDPSCCATSDIRLFAVVHDGSSLGEPVRIAPAEGSSEDYPSLRGARSKPGGGYELIFDFWGDGTVWRVHFDPELGWGLREEIALDPLEQERPNAFLFLPDGEAVGWYHSNGYMNRFVVTFRHDPGTELWSMSSKLVGEYESGLMVPSILPGDDGAIEVLWSYEGVRTRSISRSGEVGPEIARTDEGYDLAVGTNASKKIVLLGGRSGFSRITAFVMAYNPSEPMD